LAFLTLRSFIKKYQKRDFATTVFGAKILILYSFGAGFASDGRWRPMTWYSLRRPVQKEISFMSLDVQKSVLDCARNAALDGKIRVTEVLWSIERKLFAVYC